MKKKSILMKELNRIIENILKLIVEKDNFLILTHNNPDEDAIASSVSFAIVLKKFNKNVSIFLKDKIHEHFQYLLQICEYNSIKLIKSFNSSIPVEVITVCDTPKKSMISLDKKIEKLLTDKKYPVIEIDHHIGADSEYIGDKGLCLVSEASSASELVGHIVLKLRNKKSLLKKFQIENPLSRNIVLSILTGIIGDTNMGKYLKTKRERKYYNIFTDLYNEILSKETTNVSNFSDKQQVFNEIKRLSDSEEKCFTYMMKKKKETPSFRYIALTQKDSEYIWKHFDKDIVISVARSLADFLAEESGKLSLLAYYEDELLQLRVRRSQAFKSFDVRNILTELNIESGGGHEGAIGFRVPVTTVDNHSSFIKNVVSVTESMIDQQKGR